MLSVSGPAVLSLSVSGPGSLGVGPRRSVGPWAQCSPCQARGSVCEDPSLTVSGPCRGPANLSLCELGFGPAAQIRVFIRMSPIWSAQLRSACHRSGLAASSSDPPIRSASRSVGTSSDPRATHPVPCTPSSDPRATHPTRRVPFFRERTPTFTVWGIKTKTLPNWRLMRLSNHLQLGV